jgi:hypothetical protein
LHLHSSLPRNTPDPTLNPLSELEDSANMLELDVLATEIMDDLQTALEQFSLITADLDANRLTLTP